MKVRLVQIFTLLVTVSSILTGCWDLKDPQDINYFTAIGFDYVNGRFIVYVQMLDFASVASPANEKPTENIPVWTGRGIGDTASSAFNDLYESAQLRVFYGHVNAILFTENMMKHGLDNIFDLISRNHELRYTPWVFGTKDSMQEVLSTSTFFNMSPLTSYLHQPQDIYKQKSFIPPVMLREFISNYREPAKTAFLPSITLIENDWKADLKPVTMLDRNGVFTFHDSQYNGDFIVPELMGLRFVTEQTERTPLVVRDDETIYTEIAMRNPKVKITPLVQGDRVTFRLETSLDGNVVEVIQELPETEIEKLAEEHVYEEIMSTFEKSIAKGVDIYQLEHALYHQKTNDWKRLAKDGHFQIERDSLDLVSAERLKLPLKN
mgnify:CR=1 FL=1